VKPFSGVPPYPSLGFPKPRRSRNYDLVSFSNAPCEAISFRSPQDVVVLFGIALFSRNISSSSNTLILSSAAYPDHQ